MLRHVDPVEVPVPGEAADLEVGAVPVVVLHGAVVDDVDDGDDEGAGLVLGPLEEGLQPLVAALAVGVLRGSIKCGRCK